MSDLLAFWVLQTYFRITNIHLPIRTAIKRNLQQQTIKLTVKLNFKIRCDVTFSRLHIFRLVPMKHMCCSDLIYYIYALWLFV